MEAFLLHHIHRYLKKLCHESETEPIFTHEWLKKGKKFKNKLYFFSLRQFVILHWLNVNPCEYSVAVLKGQGFQTLCAEKLRP